MKRLHTYFFVFITGFLVLSGDMVSGQTPQLNEEKYWNYREKLRNEFMLGIGPEIGMSTPAAIRDTVSGVLQWTDATMDLGQYIGILAMEYRIQEERGIESDETIEELFYALFALNRLDYDAERFFGGTPSLNGFFMRDDIEEDSLDMPAVLAHLNQGLEEPKIFALDSDHMDVNPRNNEESLDQVILLITGLGLVTRCVPEDVVFIKNNSTLEFQDFETSLKLESENIITRIVNYMKEGDSSTVTLDIGDPNLYGMQGEAWDFIIKNPVSYEPVLRGENAFLLSKGYTSAKYHFTSLYSPTADMIMDTIADTIFKSFEYFIVPNDQDFKVINLNAMSNYWPDGLMDDTSNTDYNARLLGLRSLVQGYEWIPMLHQMVFEGNRNYLMSFVPPDTLFYNDPWGYYEYLLNLAPEEGPYNYGNGVWPVWEWSSTSRTIQPGRRGETSNGFPGNYNGLDYMLYYNMLTLLLSNTVISEELPKDILSIYPNPCREQIYMEHASPGDFEIHDLSGKLVLNGSIRGSGTVRMDGLKPGMYIIRLTDKNNNTYTKKLIKKQY